MLRIVEAMPMRHLDAMAVLLNRSVRLPHILGRAPEDIGLVADAVSRALRRGEAGSAAPVQKAEDAERRLVGTRGVGFIRELQAKFNGGLREHSLCGSWEEHRKRVGQAESGGHCHSPTRVLDRSLLERGDVRLPSLAFEGSALG